MLLRVGIFLLLASWCQANLLPRSLTWEGGSVAFPSASLERLFYQSGLYKPQEMVATKAVAWLDKLIVLTSRFRKGIPASVLLYNIRSFPGNPKFTPFPSLTMHEEGNCQAIQNAVDIYMDQMGLLWVLDTGLLYQMEEPVQTCPPKILCIAPTTGRVLRTIAFSDLVTSNTSRLQHIVVDYDESRNAFVYVSDAPNRAVLIYDVQDAKGYRLLLTNEMVPTVDGQDVMYLALTKRIAGPTTLFMTYLNNSRIFSISTEYLRSGNTEGRVTDVGGSSQQIILLGTNTFSRIFFRYANNSVIYTWDTSAPFSQESTKELYRSSDNLVPTSVISDVRVVFKVLESNFQDYLEGTVGVGVAHQLVDLTTNVLTSL